MPRNVRPGEKRDNHITFAFEMPECGAQDVQKFEIELIGESPYSTFHVIRREIQRSEMSNVVVQGLIPGTSYRVQVRAIGSRNIPGEWTAQERVSTSGRGK